MTLSRIERILIAELWAASLIVAGGLGMSVRSYSPVQISGPASAVVRAYKEELNQIGERYNELCRNVAQINANRRECQYLQDEFERLEARHRGPSAPPDIKEAIDRNERTRAYIAGLGIEGFLSGLFAIAAGMWTLVAVGAYSGKRNQEKVSP